MHSLEHGTNASIVFAPEVICDCEIVSVYVQARLCWCFAHESETVGPSEAARPGIAPEVDCNAAQKLSSTYVYCDGEGTVAVLMKDVGNVRDVFQPLRVHEIHGTAKLGGLLTSALRRRCLATSATFRICPRHISRRFISPRLHYVLYATQTLQPVAQYSTEPSARSRTRKFCRAQMTSANLFELSVLLSQTGHGRNAPSSPSLQFIIRA